MTSGDGPARDGTAEKRRWIGTKDFLDGIALGQTMPGPSPRRVTVTAAAAGTAAAARTRRWERGIKVSPRSW